MTKDIKDMTLEEIETEIAVLKNKFLAVYGKPCPPWDPYLSDWERLQELKAERKRRMSNDSDTDR